MKKYIVLFVALFSLASASAQSCKKKYKHLLEPNSKLVKCGSNYTLEKTKDNFFIFKEYYTENKTITQRASFKSKKMEVLHGLYEESYDDGTLVMSGMFKDNSKVGQWREDINKIGFYHNNMKFGEWKTYDEDTLVISLNNYVYDELHGEQIKYDSVGAILSTTMYEHGQMVNSTMIDSSEMKEEMPRYLGCEDMGLEEEIIKCARKKMLTYVYKNMKYPYSAKKNNIQGTAKVEFVIDKEGNVTDVKVLNGLCKDIKEEVLRIISNMPRWRPGYQLGEPVKVKYKLPVKFRLK